MRWFLIVVLALAGCKKSPEPVAVAPPPPRDPASIPPPVYVAGPSATEGFWKWAAANIDALKAVKTGHEPVTVELARMLDEVDEGFVFELGVGHEPLELIISADGKKALFPKVQQFVAAAPAIPGVKVIAFRQRKVIDEFSMKVGETTLAGKDLWFVAAEDPNRKGLLGIDVFIVGMKGEHDEALENAAFVMLEATLGEYDLETKIGEIQFKPAPGKLAAPLKPLKELPAVLDARNQALPR